MAIAHFLPFSTYHAFAVGICFLKFQDLKTNKQTNKQKQKRYELCFCLNDELGNENTVLQI